MSLVAIRGLFLSLCILAGYAISQVQPELIHHPALDAPPSVFGILIGFGFGGLLIAFDEMLKGLSLRAFSAATFGLVLGTMIAWLVDRSELFVYVDEYPVRWLIRLCLFIGFSYIGMVMAMRSNKDDFSLIIPYVRFSPQDKSEDHLLLDTSVIIDGRIADLIDARFVEGILIVPEFVLREIQTVADSSDSVRRERGRRGLDMLSRIQKNVYNEVKVYEQDVDAPSVDEKLVVLAKMLRATLYTNDYNLGKIAELRRIRHVNINELASALKPVILPGERLRVRIAKQGRDKGQGVGYLNDGTMIVVNGGNDRVGKEVSVEVGRLLQNATGTMIFAEIKD
ncbi:MAG: twitching motility protein PilT [Verrucomicrobiales bacterium]|nr:twitching motility protein PilT [Verrucomicrobiales bacterium]|tara:strand:- start:751 stop:1767 length:1017 start_codon:yes stop_codon:yes gene_type:complete